MFSHRAISAHRSRWWCLCVCVRCSIGGWCTTASVSKYFTPSHHSYAWVRFTSFPRFTCRWMRFVLFNIMQSWFRCEQVSKGLFCFTNNTVNNQHNLSYMHLAVNVPSNFISCWAKLFSIGRTFWPPEQKHSLYRPVQHTQKTVNF